MQWNDAPRPARCSGTSDVRQEAEPSRAAAENMWRVLFPTVKLQFRSLCVHEGSRSQSHAHAWNYVPQNLDSIPKDFQMQL